MANNYYYEQPFEDTTYTTTTTTETPPNDDAVARRNRLSLIFIIAGIVVLLIIALFLIFAKSPSSTNTNTNTNQKVNLQIWGAFLSNTVMQPLIDEYESQNQNITIDYNNKFGDGSFITSPSQYKSELNRVLRTNDSVSIPDIFMLQNSWVGDYDTQYISAAPTDVIDYDTLKSTFYPAVAEDFAHNQAVFGLPLWMDTLAILYNKDLLAAKSVPAPPTNWTDFKSAAQLLTTKAGSTLKQGGFAAGTGNNVSYGFELANLLLEQNGVQITNSQGQFALSTDPNSLVSLNYYKSFALDSNNTWSDTIDGNPSKSDASAFLEGRAAMIAATSYRYRDILKYNKLYEIGLNIGVSQIPQSSGQDQPLINWSDYWGMVVAKNRPTANQVAAWQFMRWLTQPEQLTKISDNVATETGFFGMLYPRTDMSSNVTSPELKVYNDSLPYARTWYMVKGLEVRDEFLKLLSNPNQIDSSSLATTENAIQLLMQDKGKI